MKFSELFPLKTMALMAILAIGGISVSMATASESKAPGSAHHAKTEKVAVAEKCKTHFGTDKAKVDACVAAKGDVEKVK